MNEKNLQLWNELTFITESYRKNFDLMSRNDNIITEYQGEITEYIVDKAPKLIGEYGFSIWNIELGNKLGIDIMSLIDEYSDENSYGELLDVIESNVLSLNDYKKILVIHTVVLCEDYRKKGIVEEFTEMIYRDFYSDDVAILALVKPFQTNSIDTDYFLNEAVVTVKESIKPYKSSVVPAVKYYSLNELIKNTDIEAIEYRLFSVASKCGFRRLNESYLFKFNPEMIEKRMIENRNHMEMLEA